MTTVKEAQAFREGWATGYQECAEGLVIDASKESGDRPAAETAALERWLFVRAASAQSSAADLTALRQLVEKWRSKANELEQICLADAGCDGSGWDAEVELWRECADELSKLISEAP